VEIQWMMMWMDGKDLPQLQHDGNHPKVNATGIIPEANSAGFSTETHTEETSTYGQDCGIRM